MKTRSYLRQVKEQVRQHLESLTFAPSVEFSGAPPAVLVPELDESDLNPDERYGGSLGQDSVVISKEEFYD